MLIVLLVIVLGKQGQSGSPIHQTTAQPGPETLQSSLQKRLRRTHRGAASEKPWG